MNRRGFLATFAAALVADPEKLLWEPNKKLISIPKPSTDWLKMQAIVSSRQAPGIIDFINLKEWWRIEVKPSDYYDVHNDILKGYFECRLTSPGQSPKTLAYRSL